MIFDSEYEQIVELVLGYPMSKLLEITHIQILGHQAVALVGEEVIASVELTLKDAPEKLLRRLQELGYTSKQISPSPDGSRLLIWV